MVPAQIFDQIADKCGYGVVLALASPQDGAVMEVRWCNRAFTKLTGFQPHEVIGQRGTVLIGSDLEQDCHLAIIEKLMNWEPFSQVVSNNRKSGERYRQQMSWVPLSDPQTGDRWWMCSLVKIEPAGQSDTALGASEPGSANLEVEAKLHRQIQRLQTENARLHRLAQLATRESHEDMLTGLSNRRHFEIELKSWIAAFNDGGSDFAVFYVDLDRFKSVNDTLGHEAGDALLIMVAETLKGIAGQSDFVARLGGDEFIILKRLGRSALDVSQMADAIIENLRRPFCFEGKTIACRTSVGVAIARAGMESPEQVVSDADTALYRAKARGRDRWSFFTKDMHVASIAAKQLAEQLLVACEQEQFVPFFHPVIDVRTGAVACAEVLVRWAHPSRGLLYPGEFLDTAADIGVLKRIDEIVFARLCEAIDRFDAHGVHVPRFAVNVSAGRLAGSTLVHDIKSSTIDPRRFGVEILESVYLDRMCDDVRWTLDELNDLGVVLALDDFGTGHASVQGLLSIRPSVLKIDRAFIRPLAEDEASRQLVSSIIGIGKSLGMQIVAEGVETQDQARLATAMGCDYLQGFLFGIPMPADDFMQTFRRCTGQYWTAETAPNRQVAFQEVS